MPPRLTGPSRFPPRLRCLQTQAKAFAGERHHFAAQGTAQAAPRARTRFEAGRSSFQGQRRALHNLDRAAPRRQQHLSTRGGPWDAPWSGQPADFGARAAERRQERPSAPPSWPRPLRGHFKPSVPS
ncbi:hypothetical protein NDU88_002655 [Pleurodeles waltl]|uniref:Uncharacterized protein n=1 Tax=Pleurodeles waltl TaxID=8319 RepID=A0AAV7M252_PLEWA|nr:hypothetical protein NDU88_002655 [Pleurodeles waltl]